MGSLLHVGEQSLCTLNPRCNEALRRDFDRRNLGITLYSYEGLMDAQKKERTSGYTGRYQKCYT